MLKLAIISYKIKTVIYLTNWVKIEAKGSSRIVYLKGQVLEAGHPIKRLLQRLVHMLCSLTEMAFKAVS